jgi:hypothetical protein
MHYAQCRDDHCPYSLAKLSPRLATRAFTSSTELAVLHTAELWPLMHYAQCRDDHCPYSLAKLSPRPLMHYAQCRDRRGPKSGLLLPKVGIIVAHTFFAKLSPRPATRTSVPPTELCRPNKIYKINSVPARLTATGRLLECSAFTVFLDTATSAERTLCRVTTSRMSSRIYRLSKLY